jgi:hypothetical protein|tara:strand:+ start:722 stop:1141 length:420 start_codon:yes stop_codon:yes gene_type:complete
MATTTATITLNSSDIADNNISISNTATLTTAGTTTGITETTGLARKKVASSSLADLITVANTDVTAAKSAKVFIHNTSTATDKYGLIGIGDSSGTPTYIGRLYGGDFMFFPWDANSGEDITLTMSDATETIIEYMVFFE